MRPMFAGRPPENAVELKITVRTLVQPCEGRLCEPLPPLDRKCPMTFDEWFRSKQGEPYYSMWAFARDAWQESAKQEREACAQEAERQMDDEPYGHAKFRCANIAAAIRARGDAE